MTTIEGLILLYWNFREHKWVDKEDFAVNSGSTHGMQWFCIPNGLSYKGNNIFYENRRYKMVLQHADVQGYVDHNGHRDLEDGKTVKEFWMAEPLQERPELQLLTDSHSQLPFCKGSNPEGTDMNIFWFVPCPHFRMISTPEARA